MENTSLLNALVAKLGAEKAKVVYDKIISITNKKVKTPK
jgi:hypothetical protein